MVGVGVRVNEVLSGSRGGSTSMTRGLFISKCKAANEGAASGPDSSLDTFLDIPGLQTEAGSASCTVGGSQEPQRRPVAVSPGRGWGLDRRCHPPHLPPVGPAGWRRQGLEEGPHLLEKDEQVWESRSRSGRLLPLAARLCHRVPPESICCAACCGQKGRETGSRDPREAASWGFPDAGPRGG